MTKFFTPERLAAMLRGANVGWLCLTPLIAILVWPQHGPVEALLPVDGDRPILRRLQRLEDTLRRDPGDILAATEVSRIWKELGQSAWSYTAIREAERKGTRNAESSLRLAAAYLDLGELDDARRNLALARKECESRSCAEPVEVKLSLFTRLTDNMIREGIEPKRDLVFTEQEIRKLLREMSGTPTPPSAGGSSR